METQEKIGRAAIQPKTVIVLAITACVIVILGYLEWQAAYAPVYLNKEMARRNGHVAYERLGSSQANSGGPISGLVRMAMGKEDGKQVRGLSFDPVGLKDTAFINAYPTLSNLRLRGQEVTPTFLAQLAVQPDLIQLDLVDVTLSPTSLQAIGKQSNLLVIHFKDCSFSDSDLAGLQSLPQLTTLSFNNCQLAPKMLAEFQKLKALTKLSLIESGVDDQQLALLHGASTALTFEFGSAHITESGVLGLRAANPRWTVIQLDRPLPGTADPQAIVSWPSREELPKLTRHGLSGPLITDASLAELVDAQGLTGLTISNCGISDRGLKHLHAFPDLEELSISNCSITDEGLKQLESCRNLKSLSIYKCPISEAGLTSLSQLENLTSLTISQGHIADRLEPLKSLSKLQELSLVTCDTTDAGLATICQLAALEHLIVISNGITDAGLAHLTQLKSLKTLMLGGRDIPEETLSQLRSALPGCQINVSKDQTR